MLLLLGPAPVALAAGVAAAVLVVLVVGAVVTAGLTALRLMLAGQDHAPAQLSIFTCRYCRGCGG